MSYRKFIIFIVVFVQSVALSVAQNIGVVDFRIDESDLTAMHNGGVIDQNGYKCALIKVSTLQKGFSFSIGSSLSIIKTVSHPETNEIWLYVPFGTHRISIFHPTLGGLRDYAIPCDIEKGRTYLMKITANDGKKNNSQYVVFKVIPNNALVELDGQLLETRNGEASKLVRLGSHEYSVMAPNYYTMKGAVIVDNIHEKKIINIELQSNLSQITLNAGDNAEIWVNGIYKGNNTWTGELAKGSYYVETKKEGYRTVSENIEVGENEIKTFSLQTPMPLYGSLNVTSSPSDAEIFVDDKLVGNTPAIVNDLLVGKHKLLIKKGEATYFEDVVIQDGKIIVADGILSKKSIVINRKYIKKIDRYDVLGEYTEGYAPVRRDSLWGFIDTEGNEVIPCVYDEVSNFINGYASIKANNKYGLVDLNCKVIVPPKYDLCDCFYDGMAEVCMDDKYGYCNITGENIIPCSFSAAGLFSEGYAWVKINDKFGYINKKGEVVIDCIYDDAFDFKGGVARVKNNDKYGYIDRFGNLLINCRYDDASDFVDGMAVVKIQGKYGYIDRNGQVIINCIYDDASDFKDGLATIKNGGKYGCVDKKGSVIVDCIYENNFYFQEGLALVKKNNKYGYIEKTGRPVTDCIFDDALPFHEGVALVTKDDKSLYIDKMGKVLLEAKECYFPIAVFFNKGLLIVGDNKKNKRGCIDMEEKVIVKQKFNQIKLHNNNIILAYRDSTWGFITKNSRFKKIKCKEIYDKQEFGDFCINAQFLGGENALLSYLSNNIKYPAIAQENNIQGRAIVEFIVAKDGSITNVKIIKSTVDKSCDKEAVRVVSSMPKWKPASLRGKYIRVRYTVPIMFRLT